MIKNQPLISIIITYYRKKNYIKETLNSIINQTYKNYELILVYDDGIKDDLKYLKSILTKFKKKKIIINKNNIGVAKSRNLAIKFCKGEYVTFIDSDDIWKKNKLKFQVNFMIKNLSIFSFTSYNVISHNGNFLSCRKVFVDADYKNLIESNFIGLSTVMVKKKIFKDIKFPNLKTQEDFALWLKLIRKGHKLMHINKVLSCWRKSKNSLSSNKFQKLKDAFKLFNKYENKNFIFSIYSVLVLTYNKLNK